MALETDHTRLGGTAISPLATEYYPNSQDVYAKIGAEKRSLLREKHAWIVKPIYRARDAVLEMAFYAWVKAISSLQEFRAGAVGKIVA